MIETNVRDVCWLTLLQPAYLKIIHPQYKDARVHHELLDFIAKCGNESYQDHLFHAFELDINTYVVAEHLSGHVSGHLETHGEERTFKLSDYGLLRQYIDYFDKRNLIKCQRSMLTKLFNHTCSFRSPHQFKLLSYEAYL